MPPKETIDDRNGINDRNGVKAQVTWSRDAGYVQVATLSGDPEKFVEWCKQIVADAESGELPNNEIMGMGQFWTPNRHQINELIRVLRRARDMAFGRDE